ncbi:MAG: hypothetical protein ABW215_15730 [Kibdelosporangium sp.]
MRGEQQQGEAGFDDGDDLLDNGRHAAGNHFGNKEELFTAVLTESSAQVAEAREAIIRRHLAEVTDLAHALIVLRRALADRLARLERFRDPEVAARQFIALITDSPVDEAAAAVHTFRYGHLPR